MQQIHEYVHDGVVCEIGGDAHGGWPFRAVDGAQSTRGGGVCGGGDKGSHRLGQTTCFMGLYLPGRGERVFGRGVSHTFTTFMDGDIRCMWRRLVRHGIRRMRITIIIITLCLLYWL